MDYFLFNAVFAQN